ncbi:MAG: phosphoenolpyruvate--protein phosphotransferase, partial [Myxococcales bacterium]|nr:phosphoenolpyruvate--protein phosphotransferase [Myxococcales bacterium]
MIDKHTDNLGTVLQGEGVSDGIVLGHATRWDRHEIHVEHVRLPESLVAAEVTRFRAAVDRADSELGELYEQLATSGLAEGETLGLLDAHKMMLRDPAILGDTERYIKDERLNAEWALSMTLKRYEAMFANMKDPFFRERGQDVAHIGERLYRFLVEPDAASTAGAAMEIPRGAILVAKTLSPAEALAASRHGVAAFVLETGTPTGHTAIVARSTQVPTVIGLPGVCDLVGDGDRIIVDGLEGEVVVRPSQYEELLYNRRAQRAKAVRKTVRQNKALPAVTPDGTTITLRANLDFPTQAATVEQHGGLGVGLFRTEFLFLERSTPPSEDEQAEVYAELLRAMRPHPVTIRTLDIGGDKAFEFLGGPKALPTELRAIRYCLAHEEVFLTQLRALLRASGHGELRVLLPFVTAASEIRRTKQLIMRASAELSERGVRHDPDIAIGAMIELPAAALTADLIAKEVDFLS